MAQTLFGDCRQTLQGLPDKSVQMCITSPPYWRLRSYLDESDPLKAFEIGSEPTLGDWVRVMVEVFAQVHRVLKDDGTLWLNLGDAYAGTHTGAGLIPSARRDDALIPTTGRAVPGLKPKDLMGQPWRVAFALQEWGWYLRQDIIWHKPNPMPESAHDRCTKAHEYLFLLSKSERYYFDHEAFKEPVGGGAHARRSATGVGFGHGTDAEQRQRPRQTHKTPDGWATGKGEDRSIHRPGRKLEEPGKGTKNNTSMDAALANMVEMRNRRSVWTIPTQAFKDAHFATFPTDLVEPCVIAGSRPGDVVLDPFHGSGTVGQVAQSLGRDWIGCELNRNYLPMQQLRTAQTSLILE